MALRRRTQRRYSSTSSDSLRTGCADTCGSTCQPPAARQSAHFHRAPGEDFRALFPVQSAPLNSGRDTSARNLFGRLSLLLASARRAGLWAFRDPSLTEELHHLDSPLQRELHPQTFGEVFIRK